MGQFAEPDDALRFLAFWLRTGKPHWFVQSDAFDAACRDWLPLYQAAREWALGPWEASAAGSLALTIVLDQLPRNLFRGTAEQFATDAAALGVAERAIAAGHDQSRAPPELNFYYLPFQHAENLAVQERGLNLYRAAGDREAYYFALLHADAIRRFGRFPHRNAVLGRQTTAAEQAYLDSGGFAV